MAKKTTIKNAEIDMEKVDAFNDFMISKGAFVRVGDQLIQDPEFKYPYGPLFEEFHRNYNKK